MHAIKHKGMAQRGKNKPNRTVLERDHLEDFLNKYVKILILKVLEELKGDV